MEEKDRVIRRAEEIAKRSEGVQALLITGSRADPSRIPDRYSDYDLIFAVSEGGTHPELAESFRREFAPLVIEQQPDPPGGARYGFLMQFRDVRIDLSVVWTDALDVWIRSEYFVKAIWVREGFLLPDLRRNVPPPDPQEFSAACNEFWWVCPYVAKGLARGDLLYANFHLENCLRRELHRVFAWAYPDSGKFLCRLAEAIGEEKMERYRQSFDLSEPEAVRRAFATVCALFSETAPLAAERLGTRYDRGEEERVRSFLRDEYGI